MTLALPRIYTGPLQTNLPATPSVTAYGTLVTASGTNTKGSWASVVDPVTFDCYGLYLTAGETGTAVTDTGVLLDIGIGPTGGGSEQVIVENLMVGWRLVSAATIFTPLVLYLPIFIPKGVRVSARCQSVISADTCRVHVALIPAPSGLTGPMCAGVDAFGVDTADSGGTLHTAGSSGAESSWANIGSTTGKKYHGVFMLPQRNNDTTLTNLATHYEVGYTTGGSADFTIGEWLFVSSTNESWAGPYPPCPVMAPIPSGAQMRIRGESSGTPEAVDVAIYCLY